MTRRLEGLTSVVEVLASMPKTKAQWKQIAGADFPLIAGCLRPAGQTASIYPCASGCRAGQGREIREQRKQIVAVCRGRRCEKVVLKREEIDGFDCDVGALGASIAAALGGVSVSPEETPAWRWWRIGTLERGASRVRLPLILSTTITARETNLCVGALVASGLAPFTLIVPRAGVVDLATLGILNRESCEVIVLEDRLRVDEKGRLVAGPPPAGTNVFRLDRGRRLISFEGVSSRVEETKGITYIAHLLASPRTHVEPAALQAVVGGAATQTKLSRGDEVLDEEALTDFRARLAKIDEELEEAREFERSEKIAELEEERRAIAQEIKSAIGIRDLLERENGLQVLERVRHKRRLGDDVDRIRRQVRGAIIRALEALDVDHPEFARHFRRSFVSEATFAYAPENDLLWEVSS
ncbi:MAG TPA: hypothetical protein VHF22_02040 [Planctomycetota bacterium]|nr:hypothetical protein [Planctomycetota bacterium]